MYNYIDKDGNQIESGDLISISGDKPEMVYSVVDHFGREDLGINASNEAYLKNHPGAVREYYSLRNFSCREIEKVSDK